jgi:hypothetical protein
MPRLPQTKNLANPLRVLRGLCSEYGAAVPIPQIRLSQLTGITPDYVRSLENARRRLSPVHLEKIKHSIGAVWNPQRKQWVVNNLPDEPFDYEWFKRYQTLWFDDAHQIDIEVHHLCRCLQALLLNAEPEDYNRAFDRIFSALKEIRSGLKINGARSVFEKAAFDISYGRDTKTGEIKFIVRQFKHQDGEIVRIDPRSLHSGYLDLTPWAAEPRHIATESVVPLKKRRRCA